jgi:hypothetical protein
MPDDKLNSLERVNISALSQSGSASLLSSDTENSESLTMLESRYKAVQEFVGQLSNLQGRLPIELDKKLQALLQQLNVEQQSLGDSLNTKQPPEADTTSVQTLPTPAQQSLQQLSILLSQQPPTNIPTVIKNQTGQPLTADTIYAALTKIIQQQPPTWRQDTSLGKNALNWLLQSQLSLKPDYWPSLSQPAKNQLIQAGISQPITLATPMQRQLIQQINTQTFNLLIQQKNVTTITPEKNIAAQPIQNTATNNIQIETNTGLKTALNSLLGSLTSEDLQRPEAVKILLQQAKVLLLQPSQMQPLINNPLLNEINIKQLTDNGMVNIQSAVNALLMSVTSAPPSSPNIIWQRLLLQLSVPKIMQSPELLNQIKTSLSEQIWLPTTIEELKQYQNDFESLKNNILDFTQQISASQPQTLNSAFTTLVNKTTTPSQNENTVNAIEAISRNSKGNSLAALQQLFHSLQQELLPQPNIATADRLPPNLQSAASLLLDQFNLPLQTSDNVRNWMQFLLQPLDGDGAYAKSMQQWFLQLLQVKSKTTQKMQQMKTEDSSEMSNIKNQLKTLNSLSESTADALRPASQPNQNSAESLPSLLHFPLPAQQNGEQGSLNLQRNTREDNERGWNISVYLEPAKLGPIRFQARIALPEIALSIVAEKTTTIDLIKQTYPLLEQRFQSLGLTPQTLQIRQGKIKRETASTTPHPSSGLFVKV